MLLPPRGISGDQGKGERPCLPEHLGNHMMICLIYSRVRLAFPYSYHISSISGHIILFYFSISTALKSDLDVFYNGTHWVCHTLTSSVFFFSTVQKITMHLTIQGVTQMQCNTALAEITGFIKGLSRKGRWDWIRKQRHRLFHFLPPFSFPALPEYLDSVH